MGCTVSVEGAYTGAVGLPPALLGEAVRGVQEPESRPDRLGTGVQAE
jgi:hypothetical protein